MFTSIYELLCGKNDDPVYASDVYPNVGLFTLYLLLFSPLYFIFCSAAGSRCGIKYLIGLLVW